MGMGTGQSNAGADTAVAARVRRVVVVDDQRTFADLLRVALDGLPDLACPAAAYDLDSGLELVAALRPEIVITEVRFDGDHRDGVHAAAEITARFPGTLVLLLTATADAGLVARAAAAGASALMAKNGSLPELISTLRLLAPGGLTVHPSVMGALVSRPHRHPGPLHALSKREREVLDMLMIGLDARAVARRLGISLHTCRGYVKALLRKLDAHSQLEAVAIARQHGYAEASPGR